MPIARRGRRRLWQAVPMKPLLVLLSLLPLLPAGAVSAVTFPAQITLEPTGITEGSAPAPRPACST